MFLVTVSSPTNYPDMLAINLFPHLYIILSFFLRMFYKWNHTICDSLRFIFFTQHEYPEISPRFHVCPCSSSLLRRVFCTTLLHSLAIHSLKDVCLVPVWGYYNKMLHVTPTAVSSSSFVFLFECFYFITALLKFTHTHKILTLLKCTILWL